MASKPELRAQFGKEWEKHYTLDILKERGYSRKECKQCKRYFWSKNERENCGDSSCVGYEFIGNPPSNRKLSYTDTWREIEKYFTSNKHTSIKPYPTVARWRDDLYFTIASINNFQPYVVSGEMPPPANPLIVPQPCIRFSDLANVGVTGRHYTNFVMIGQCAFNNKQTKEFYWKNEAILHDINYLKALGIPEDELTFKEDVWIGGGNFGPSMEYFCKGIELGNCVFMQYESLGNGHFRELETKVIDMGAGLERLCWITHGTPTSYDLVFGHVIGKMKKTSGIKVDDKLLEGYAKLSGVIDVEEGHSKHSEEEVIARKLGVDKKELFGQLNPLFSLYATADHLATVLFATTDGQLPSNMGGGYNLRLILRRAFGFNDEYEWNLDWNSIIEGHASHLSPLFPHLQEGAKTAIAVVDEELSKYRATQKKAKGKIANLVQRTSREQREITIQELTTLYISDGIPPEMVEAVAKEQKLKIKIPEDFYSKIRNSDEETAKKQAVDVLGLPKTEMLCYRDDLKFKGRVLAIKDGWIVLDKTGFYAESGGQVSDEGTLNNQDVIEVKNEAGVILHKISNPGKFIVGDYAEGEIKEDKRRQITAHHTGAHVLNAAARDVLGTHVWQCGSFKDENKAHLDLTHYKRITDEELNAIEMKANEIIASNLQVKTDIYPRTVAEEKFGFRIYQGGAVPGLNLRIVSIGNIDHQACGGTHAKQTGDIGLFKLIKRESVQDGVERVSFKCYLAAVKYVQERDAVIKQLASELSIPEKLVIASVMKFFEEWKERGKKLAKLEEAQALLTVKKEIEKAKEEGKDKIELSSVPWSSKKVDLAAKQISDAGLIAILSNKDKFIVISLPEESKENALELLKSKGAKGGGNEKIARGKLA
ncbi:MAG: alanine--tRNA ligase [Candidatus Micrarchaeota archaeon]